MPATKDTYPTPSPDSVIWHYLRLPALCSILQRKQLFFRRVSLLRRDDPWEGYYPKKVKVNLEDTVARNRERWPDLSFVEPEDWEMRLDLCVHCWHENGQPGSELRRAGSA